MTEKPEVMEFRPAPLSARRDALAILLSAFALAGLLVFFPDLSHKLQASIDWRLREFRDGNFFGIAFEAFFWGMVLLMMKLFLSWNPVAWAKKHPFIVLFLLLIGYGVCAKLMPFILGLHFGLFIWLIRWRSESWICCRIDSDGLRVTEGMMSSKTEHFSWSQIYSCEVDDVDRQGNGDLILNLGDSQRVIDDLAEVKQLRDLIQQGIKAEQRQRPSISVDAVDSYRGIDRHQ